MSTLQFTRHPVKHEYAISNMNSSIRYDGEAEEWRLVTAPGEEFTVSELLHIAQTIEKLEPPRDFIDEAWYVLYDGQTTDGWDGRVEYVGRTRSLAVARDFLNRHDTSPYFAGFVRVYTNDGVRDARNSTKL